MDRSTTQLGRLCGALVAAAALATVVPAVADHRPPVPRALAKKHRPALDALRRLTYAYTETVPLAPVSCDCMERTCGDDQRMVACGGEVSPIGILTATRRTSREPCLVCGCGGDVPADLSASPVCIGF